MIITNIIMSKTQASCGCSSRRDNHFCNFFHPHSAGRVSFLKCISYKELNRATDRFRRIITCDSQSITYEATFEDGSVSVVKEVRTSVHQGNEAFLKELRLLGCLHHRHVVSLRGYSVGRRSFLVFESTAKGSLKEHLNDPLKTPLSWKTRVQIAIGVAAALEYLQFFCQPPVYHMSISSSDIILDEKLVPKLSNIGFLCSLEGENSIPAASQAAVKADMIPQFGALLLELITGQSSSRESADIIQWIRELRSNISIHNMIDPDLGISYTSKELTDLLTVARMCIKIEDTQAFTISHVVWYLQTRFGNSCN